MKKILLSTSIIFLILTNTLYSFNEEKMVRTKPIIIIDGSKKKGPEIVRGYLLPPEPDPKINNSTLLGVDSNDNMLRDDVERWIVKQNWSPKRIAASFQKARGFQLLLNEEMGNNLRKSTLKNMASDAYLSILERELHKELTLDEIFKNTRMFTQKVFNTRERRLEYDKYNRSFSGTLINGFPGSGKFSYKFADYTMEDETLGSYDFIGEERYYSQDKIPMYSDENGLIGSYWNLEKNDIQDFEGDWNDKFCEVNFKIEKNGKECWKAEDLYIENLKEKGIIK